MIVPTFDNLKHFVIEYAKAQREQHQALVNYNLFRSASYVTQKDLDYPVAEALRNDASEADLQAVVKDCQRKVYNLAAKLVELGEQLQKETK